MENNMRIGIFTDSYPPYINGVSTSVVMLEQALRKRGHQVFIVTVNAENMSYKYENNERVIRLPGIPIGIYDYRLTGIYPLRAINKIKEWNLDIIHSQTEFGVGTFARIIAKQLGIPVVHTYHTMYEDYTHYITKGYFDGSSKKIVEYLTKFYCDKTVTELIVPTQKAYDLFKEKYKVDRNVHIVPTGIDTDRFYREKQNPAELQLLKKKLGIQPKDFVTLFVGRLAKEKSVDVLIEGQAAVVKKYPHSKLLIVGDGPDVDHYKQMAKNLQISDSVIFTGKVPWEEVPKYYNASSLFATASRTETQGLTVIEAMAASLPILAADDESFKVVVVDGLNGKLFHNKKEYRKELETFIENRIETEETGHQARNNAEQYSSKYFAERVLDVYRVALGPHYKKKKTFGDKLKNVIKKGLYGK